MKLRVRQKYSVTLLTLFSLLCGCSDGPGEPGEGARKRLVLGFSPIVSWGNWNGANAESIRNAARESGSPWSRPVGKSYCARPGRREFP
jgi:hypothetical protein